MTAEGDAWMNTPEHMERHGMVYRGYHVEYGSVDAFSGEWHADFGVMVRVLQAHGASLHTILERPERDTSRHEEMAREQVDRWIAARRIPPHGPIGRPPGLYEPE